MKYEFTKDYLTGIDEIDKEHARLFEIANECYDLVMDDEAMDRFDKIVALLDELRSYAATHFANEEAYMERIQYERRFSERYQHLRFIQKLSEINLDDIDENQQEYLLGILDFLARWLYGHIKVMDCRIPKEEDIAAQRVANENAAAEPPAPQPKDEPAAVEPSAQPEEETPAQDAPLAETPSDAAEPAGGCTGGGCAGNRRERDEEADEKHHEAEENQEKIEAESRGSGEKKIRCGEMGVLRKHG